MLDHSECPQAVILQLEDPLGIIEGSAPASGAALAGIGWDIITENSRKRG